jgi:polar amino acid transport system substrate-binding protein
MERRAVPTLSAARCRRLIGAVVIACLFMVLTLTLPGGAAMAQGEIVPRDLYQEWRHLQGSSMTFCVNSSALLADFEAALAEEIADALLLVPIVVRIDPPRPTPPLDYRLPLSEEELFVLMQERCDAFMGFALATSGYPSWMIITRPYVATETVLVAAKSAWRELSDIPINQPIGTRALSSADSHFLIYLQALPQGERWRRFAYPNNEVLLDRLRDGTIGAALVWEPALCASTGVDPGAAGIHVIERLPIELPRTEFGIALRSTDRYLESVLSQAIDYLVTEGRIAEMLNACRSSFQIHDR